MFDRKAGTLTTVAMSLAVACGVAVAGDRLATVSAEGPDGTWRTLQAGEVTAEAVATFVFRTDFLSLRGSRRLWQTGLRSDLAFPAAADRGEQLARLADAIAEAAGTPVSLTARTAKVPVYVASGRWAAMGLSPEIRFDRTAVIVGPPPEDVDKRPKMEFTGPPDDFLPHLSQTVGRRVVTDAPLGVREHHGFLWYPLEAAAGAEFPFEDAAAEPDVVLNAVSLQTGLTFAPATREMELFTLRRAAPAAAPEDADAAAPDNGPLQD